MPSLRSLLASLAVCALAFGLAACGGDDESTVTETQVHTVTEPAPEPETEAADTTAADTTAEPDPSPAPAPAELSAFVTPSGNIGCQLTAKSVRCDILEFDYAPPPAPADCPVDYGDSITLEASGPAFYTCHGDTAVDPGAKALAYGASATNGPFRCDSAETGVSCTSESTGEGFSLSREAATISASS